MQMQVNLQMLYRVEEDFNTFRTEMKAKTLVPCMYHLVREQADEEKKANDHLRDIAQFILHQFLMRKHK